MSTAVQAEPATPLTTRSATDVRIVADGKFLRAGHDRFLVKGVTYGTFAPDTDGYQFPPLPQIADDFRLMAQLGLNTIRVFMGSAVDRVRGATSRPQYRHTDAAA